MTIQKLDLEWKSIPTALAWYKVRASGFGIMLKADGPIPGQFLRFEPSKNIDSQFVLSEELELLF